MGKRKSQVITIVAVISVVIFSSVALASDVIRDWKSYTSFNEVTDMVMYDGAIWVSTKGGLVRIDPDTRTCTTYTNVDGLGTNQLYSLCVDDHNRLWVSGKGRLINFTDPRHPDSYLFTDETGGLLEIYDIAASPGGDTLWLGNRLGVTVFLTSAEAGQGLILDTYTRLGEDIRECSVLRVAFDSDSIWVGTSAGFAVGSRQDIRQLKAPANWHSYFPLELNGNIESNSVTGLVAKNDTVYVGTTNGLYRFDLSPEAALVNLGLYNSPVIHNLSLSGDSVFAHTSRGNMIYFNGASSEIPQFGMPIWNTTSGLFDENGMFWAGNLAYGVYYAEDDSMKHFQTGGLPSNDCRRVVVTQGKIWCALGGSGLAYLEGGHWEKKDSVNGGGGVVSLSVGPLGELWAGTWGDGVFRIDYDSGIHFDTGNSLLSGLTAYPGYAVVSDIVSSGDAIWMGNLQGALGEIVAVNPYNTNQWKRYLLVGGPGAEWINSLTVGQGTVYVGTRENGIYAIAYRGTPFNAADDYEWQFTSSNSGIGSDIIEDLAVDSYDSLWVGTAFGLSFQSLGEIYFTNVLLPDSFGPAVTSIAFDAQGNLYAGSARGLVVRDIATGSFEQLTSRNSGLVDDDIKDLYYQSDANALWVSTSGGLSRLTMPYALAATDIKQTLAYPNPFIIRYGNEVVRFNYAGIATVRIYTLAGELVREIPVTGIWDGKNGKGQAVAAGVYIFVITDQQGENGRGKIFLVRE